MGSYIILQAYFDHARRMYNARGTLIYNERACYKLTVAGYPYARIAVDNDNEAKP